MNVLICAASRAPTTELDLGNVSRKPSCEMCTAAVTSGLSLTNWIHARPITFRYWRTKSANEERKKRGRLAAQLLVKCCHRFVQCRSIFGHARRNWATEAYEPPLTFGMIVSSKADTPSNST